MSLLELIYPTIHPIPKTAVLVTNKVKDDDSTDQRLCKKCEQEKDLSEFYFRKSRNAYTNECKTCHSIRVQENFLKRQVSAFKRSEHGSDQGRQSNATA